MTTYLALSLQQQSVETSEVCKSFSSNRISLTILNSASHWKFHFILYLAHYEDLADSDLRCLYDAVISSTDHRALDGSTGKYRIKSR